METTGTPSGPLIEVDPAKPDVTLAVAQDVLTKIHREVGEVCTRLSDRGRRLQQLEERLTFTAAHPQLDSAGFDQEAEDCESRLGVLELKLAHRQREIDELERTVVELTAERDSRSARHADLELQLEQAKRQLDESEDQVLLLWDELVESERAGAEGSRLEDALEEIRRVVAAPPSERDEALAKPEPEVDFLCFVGDAKGYRLVPRTGPLPHAGGTFRLDGKAHVTTKVAASPFPSDSRRCVYLQAAS